MERSDGTVVNPLHDDDDLSNLSSPPTTSEPSPSSTTDLVSSGSGKESPTSSSSPSVSGAAEAQSSVSLNGAAYSPPGSDSSPVMISSSGLGLSTSDLHSISSVGSGGSATSSGIQSYQHHVLNQHHGSSTSISSGGISSKDSVFTDRSSPQEPVSTTVSQRSKSTSPDGSCVPDSTTIHSTSSPLNIQLTGKMARTDSGDLGYRSGSSSSLSLRDRLMSGYSGASPMTRTDSNASSIVSNNPLSANSSVGSLQLHSSVASGTGSEFSFHSTFQQGNGLDFMSAAANPTFAPLAAPTAADQYNNGNIQYVQQQHQPIIGAATTATNNASFPLMHQQQQMGGMQFVTSTQFGGAGQMTTMHSMGNGAPQQQFMQQSNLPMNGVGGVDPNNINSLPDWTPAAPAVSDFNTTSSSSASTFLSSAGGIGGIPPQQQGVDPMFGLQTTGRPGFEYIAPSVSGNGIPQQEMYNPPPITVAGSDMYNGSTAGS